MIKYYSLTKKKFIDLDEQSCDLNEWFHNPNDYCCCKHPDGFYIFLNPEDIIKSDEYSQKDPYKVKEDIDSKFHKKRFNCTIKLINDYYRGQEIRLLDIGCGEGHITASIKAKYNNFHICGLDYSVSAISYANAHFEEIDFIVADAYSPPFTNEYFDIIICNNLLEHIPDPTRLLNVINAKLKPGGLLILSTPSRYRINNLLRIILGQEIKFLSKSHVTEYSVGQIKELFKYCGYEDITIFSPEIDQGSIKYKIVKRLFFVLLKLLKSHHVLEETVFYSSKKFLKLNS